MTIAATPTARAGEPPRVDRAPSYAPALVLLAILSAILGIVLLAIGPVVPEIWWAILLFTFVYWTWSAAGLVAWWRRPRNATGTIMLAGGLGVLVNGFANTPVPALVAIGDVFATVILAVAVHLLLAFPSGRVRGRVAVAPVIVGYAVTTVLQVPQFLVDPAAAPGVIVALDWVQRIVGIAVMVTTAVILVRRLRAADRALRRILLPVYLYGIGTIVLISLIPQIVAATGLPREVSGASQLVLSAGLPIAFLVGVLTGGFSRTNGVDALSAWLAELDGERAVVAPALARTLGDSSVRVAYRAPDRDAFVDEAGEVDVTDSDDRTWVPVSVGSRLVGAIGYDPRIVADRESVERAGSVLAIAIDREGLMTDLVAANRDLRESRRRLVEAADAERSRIARDLHDGLQVQLVLLALEAQELADREGMPEVAAAASERLRRRIDASAADLRRLVYDVLPAALAEHGLSAAVEDLIDRIDVPAGLVVEGFDAGALPPAVAQTAYLVVAESLTNAVKHARASRMEVALLRDAKNLTVRIADDGAGGARIGRGAGLRSLSDRVDALRGRLSIASPVGGGTRVEVELPCGS